ncbi:hypothetical protein BC835DRAFT_1323192 [Cytidiella melzeri]|nr:hypothetical protein BC835DRAFT_1323192 [Cytidiella melzeri]
MVHRPSDSRLLVNLLTHEKDYSKQLSALLDQSQSSLASFSAYASASTPPTSQIIIQVAGALAGADEALRKYAGSLEQWQAQLKSLKAREDEVGNVMRDREILVTRLIKLSKSQKSTRDSILASSSSSTITSTKLPEVQTSTKLAAAQSELQACEAHLATKERELDGMRNAAVTSGLSARCKALVECGWAWGEMGKEGLRAIESLEGSSHVNGHGAANGSVHTSLVFDTYKPLPDGPSSDLSSIGPSQSASQTTHANTEPIATAPTRLHIPPAHSISDQTFPLEEEMGEGSSAEEVEDAYEVRDNERFSKRSSKVVNKPKINGEAKANSRDTLPSASATSFSALNQVPKRTRRTSGSVLGSIAAFFHRSPVEHEQIADGESSPTKKQGRWQTRTDKNLTRARKGKGSDSDDELSVHQRSPVLPAAGFTGTQPPRSGSQRLKKAPVDPMKRHTTRASSMVLMERAGLSQGVLSDSGVDRQNSRRGRRIRGASQDQTFSEPESAPHTSKKGKSPLTMHVTEHHGKDTSPTPLATPAPAKNRKSSIGNAQNKSTGSLHASLATEAPLSLSRSSSLSKRSITSTTSAPVNLSALSSSSKTVVYPALGPSERYGATSHKRAASLDARPHVSGTNLTAKKNKRGQSSSSQPPNSSRTANSQLPGSQSLMSIVEDVAQQNRKSRTNQDPNLLLFVAKAPPPLSETADFLKLPDGPIHPPPIQVPPSQTPSATKTLPPRDKTASQHSIPLTPTKPAPSATTVHVPSPDMKPLRSAMRNTSRSPSPVVLPLPPPAIPARSKMRPSPSPELSFNRLAPLGVAATKEGVADGDDTSSISSYETTNEMPVDETEAEDDGNVTPHGTPPPPVSKLHQSGPSPSHKETQLPPSNDSQLSHSTSSTAVATSSAGGPARRKSVRMSLPPTFSATPPAIDDRDDDEAKRGRRYEPWSNSRTVDKAGWRSSIKEPIERDDWHDSSESEDEEYSKAKRLLGRFSRKK